MLDRQSQEERRNSKPKKERSRREGKKEGKKEGRKELYVFPSR
jgi:hypothetical protein